MSNKATAKQDAKPALVPKLRFPEFRDAAGWDEKRLGEVASFFKGKGISKAEIATNGRHPCIRYGELYTRYGEVIDEVFSRTDADEADLFFSRSNDVIIPGSGETKLDIAKASCVMHDDVALGGDLNVIRTEHNGVFLSYYFNGPKKWDIAKVAQGDTVVHLYPSQLAKLAIARPKEPEQQKIAECLSSVDELIAAQARKLDALKTHKKGLMQQLFPREGETQPRLRFPEFQNAGEWEEKKLGDVADVLMCKRIFANETNPTSGIPFYKIGTLGGTPDAFISRELFEAYKSKYNFPREGEILITCSGTVGKCLRYDGIEAYYQDSNIVWIDNPTLEVSNEFLLSILSDVNWGTLNSTTITRIYGPDLRGLAIKFPQEKAEQQRIADCLASLDDLIAGQAQKLDALKTHKKGLMQQLFPSPETEEA